MKTGSELIAQEREKQIVTDHSTPDVDDGYTDDELCRAASCYLMAGQKGDLGGTPVLWPWPNGMWWNPSEDDPITDLVKAGALIAAEIDRRQRATQPCPRCAEMEEGQCYDCSRGIKNEDGS